MNFVRTPSRALWGGTLIMFFCGCGASEESAGTGTGGADAGDRVDIGTSPGTGGMSATSGSGGVAMSGSGGAVMNGSGGGSGTGVVTGIGGNSDAGTGGRGGSTGGSPGSGGGMASGGVTGSGGAAISAGGASGNLTIWLAGDSTVANGANPCPVGWGKVFKPFFNNSVTVTNSAVGGTSLHTWLYTVGATKDASGECTLTRDGAGQPVVQAHWQNMLDNMKTGDYLLIQFGINDGGACPRYEGDAQFQTTLGMMAMAAKSRGANPVFVTPVSSISCRGSAAVGTRGRFVTDAKSAGMTYNVPVIDLEALSVALYTASGFCPLPGGAADVSATTGGAVGAFFCDDHTHFEMTGAMSIAKTVADAIRAQLPGLAAYLN